MGRVLRIVAVLRRVVLDPCVGNGGRIAGRAADELGDEAGAKGRDLREDEGAVGAGRDVG